MNEDALKRFEDLLIELKEKMVSKGLLQSSVYISDISEEIEVDKTLLLKYLEDSPSFKIKPVFRVTSSGIEDYVLIID